MPPLLALPRCLCVEKFEFQAHSFCHTPVFSKTTYTSYDPELAQLFKIPVRPLSFGKQPKIIKTMTGPAFSLDSKGESPRAFLDFLRNGLNVAKRPRLVLNSRSPCFSPPKAGRTGVCHHVWLTYTHLLLFICVFMCTYVHTCQVLLRPGEAI